MLGGAQQVVFWGTLAPKYTPVAPSLLLSFWGAILTWGHISSLGQHKQWLGGHGPEMPPVVPGGLRILGADVYVRDVHAPPIMRGDFYAPRLLGARGKKFFLILRKIFFFKKKFFFQEKNLFSQKQVFFQTTFFSTKKRFSSPPNFFFFQMTVFFQIKSFLKHKLFPTKKFYFD